MADRNDIKNAITSALTEIGVTGHLDVKMDEEASGSTLGEPPGNDVDVVVSIDRQ